MTTEISSNYPREVVAEERRVSKQAKAQARAANVDRKHEAQQSEGLKWRWPEG